MSAAVTDRLAFSKTHQTVHCVHRMFARTPAILDLKLLCCFVVGARFAAMSTSAATQSEATQPTSVDVVSEEYLAAMQDGC